MSITSNSTLSNSVAKLRNRLNATSLYSGLFSVVALGRKISLEIDVYFLTSENGADVTLPSDSLPDGYSISLFNPSADADDFLAIAALNEWSNHQQVVNRLSSGQQCIVIKYNGCVVGYTWARFDEIDEPGCDIDLVEDGVFLHGAFIHSDHRKKGLATLMRAQVYALLKEQGINYFISTTDVLNQPARKFKAKLGARHIKRYVSIRWFGRTLLQSESAVVYCAKSRKLKSINYPKRRSCH